MGQQAVSFTEEEMRTKECPKCGADVSETYQPYEPDVGIMCGGWFCDACDFFIEDDGEPDYD